MKYGLKQSNSDPCLFLNDEKSIYLIVYVHDGIIASVDEQAVKQFPEKLKSEFSVVIGVVNYFLATVPYREAIGSLMILAIVSRHEISYEVGVLSQVLYKPQQVHWSMIKRIMRYLKGTEKCGILFQCNVDNTLQCFTDSDYAGDPLSRRSTLGMIFMSYGGAVSWRSQRQSCIALSTTEAELIAASQAAKEAI
ncbi:Retrovirus-related Pol polyprotein from transposon TNT 1-94 [Araneus ventricosus]|uniref:Retrovirus-related Pol polyprotein from transposon TNT 1-94 n=1 Tax=Araneus ventricosus TaxID=182803 RepID=A0A4Y2U166_ARAVE|nr:Retrovirus-related Pol polyprotein from transposon TNT 1-94 [Araneus ventricosus]